MMLRDSRHNSATGRLVPLLIAALVVLCAVATLVSHHAIDTVDSRRVLPRWDLAAHLVNGWADFHYLKTGQWPRLGWDLWSQGYWPPGQSLFQIPFYAALGADMAAGLRSSLAAFVLAGLAGVALLGLQWRGAALLPAAIFVLLGATSPFFLGYASVTMSEMLGALAQAVVLVCHLRYEQTRRSDTARWFAIALTALFFTKYNYFILLAVPLACHVFVTSTATLTATARLQRLWHWARARLSTATGALLAVYAVVALTVELTGGFAFSVGGQRIAFRTIGYSAHPVLYLLVGRLWYLHRRGRIDWPRLWARDPRVRPLLIWFALPVTVWLLSPYPNHLKDVVNLVINVPMGEPTARTGLVAYLRAVRTDYFFNAWVLAATLVGFAVAAFRYRRQPPLIQLLILIAVLEFVMVTAHQTRDPRFLLLAMPPLWLVSASEVGTWLWRRSPTGAALAAVVVAIGAVLGAEATVRGARFQRIAFDNYVASPALHAAFATIRDAIGPADRVAVLGRRDAISPGLVRWQLGPPEGETTFPIEILRAGDVDALDHVQLVVLVAPASWPAAPPEIAEEAARDSARVQLHIEEGTLVPVGELPIDDLHVSLRLYRRVLAGN